MTAPAKDALRKSSPSFWLWGTLILFSVVVYAPMFSNGFVWDDPYFIVENPALRSLWPPARFLQSQGSPAEGVLYTLTGHRPVTTFSLALDYALWNLNPFGYHLTNLFLHLLCVWGVVFLVRGLSQSAWAGFLSGILFALHPGHAEGVIAFLGRSDLLSSLFVLLGFLCYVRHSKGDRRHKAFWVAASLLTFLLACFSKETGLVLLGLIVFYEMIGSGPWPSKIVRLLPFLLLAAFYGACRWKILGGGGGAPKWWGGSPGMNALMMLAAYARYLRLMVFPLRLAPWHTIAVPHGMSDGSVIGGAVLLVGSVGGALWALRRHPRAGLLASWFLLGLVPVANLIPIPGMIMAERWLYLPSMGLCALGGWGAWILYQRAAGWIRKAWVGLLGAALLLFGVRTFFWNGVWRTDERVARTIVATNPENPLGRAYLGNALVQEGLWAEGEQELREAIRLQPDLAVPHYNLGNVLEAQGKKKEAEESYRATIRLDPDFTAAHNNLGLLLYEQGSLPAAEHEFREAIRADSTHLLSYVNLGGVLDDLGRPAEAEAAYRRAIRLDPNFVGTYYNLAIALLHQDRNPEAIQALEEYLARGGPNRSQAEALLRQLRGK